MKNLIIAILAGAIIFLVWILLSDGCGKSTDSHSAEYEQIKAERDSLIASEQAGKHREDSLSQSLQQADTVIADLLAETHSDRIELDRSKVLAARLALEVQAYKRERDTSEYGRKVDSLVQEVIVLTAKLTEYEQKIDSLTTAFQQQKLTYESLLSEKAQLYSQLRSSYENVYVKYNQLTSDYADRGKNLKREKLKSKIAALLALVATGLFITK